MSNVNFKESANVKQFSNRMRNGLQVNRELLLVGQKNREANETTPVISESGMRKFKWVQYKQD